ncbi:MAG: thioredoxin-related protein [Roseivirga sp.]
MKLIALPLPLQSASLSYVRGLNIKRFMRVSIIIFSLFLSNICAALEVIPFIEVKSAEDWQKVLHQAQQANQLIFVDAYADWCTYCHQLDNEVYTDNEVIGYFSKNFVNVKFDTESEYGQLLAQQFGISSLPTLMFITHGELPFQTIEGFIPAPTLLAYGQATIADFERLPLLEEQYDNNLSSKEETVELIGILENKDFEKATSIAKEYLNFLNIEDYVNNLDNLWLAARFENQLNSTPYLFIQRNKAAIIEAHGKEEYMDYFKAVYNDNLELALKYGDENILYQLITDVLPEFMTPIEIAEASFITKKLYFAARENIDKYKFEVNAYMNNHIPENGIVEFLFSNALEIIENFENEELKSFSDELLTKAIQVDPTHFESTALLGYVKALLGDYSLALEILNRSKAMAIDEEQKEMAENLINAVNQMK